MSAVERDDWVVVDCPGCETPMHLGQYWGELIDEGHDVPECPDCNDTADEWSTDPRISEARAEELRE